MGYIARREGTTITASFGTVTILHEAANGILVVSRPSRKHWKKGYPDLPVNYELARLLTGDEAVEARDRVICNSAHYASMPDVFIGLSLGNKDEAGTVVLEHRVAGRNWRAARTEMIALAENYTD
jgi:hypothetical protein